jgi:tyrosyl-tRNA synthetase
MTTGDEVSSPLLDDLEARGLIQETTDRTALAKRLADGPITLYLGCDPTADSLHVGHLLGLVVLRRFQAAGHRVVALAGGATGMIGDPSGRSEERNLLDEQALTANTAAIKAQMERFVDLDGDRGQLVDNRDWTEELTVLDFLRRVGKHVTVNQMVARESVKARMASEHGISFTEFSYMLLQAHDYLWLHDNLDVDLQVGGSDQWGNIVSGVDLVRRVRGATVHGLCWPLVTGPDGAKLGKSTGGRVWLDPRRTSPYAFYQHWMQTEDREVHEHLAKFTLLDLGDVRALARDHEAAPERRKGQRVLAREMTSLVHGHRAAAAAEEASSILFGGAVDEASEGALELIAQEVTTVALPSRPPAVHGSVGDVQRAQPLRLIAGRGDLDHQVRLGRWPVGVAPRYHGARLERVERSAVFMVAISRTLPGMENGVPPARIISRLRYSSKYINSPKTLERLARLISSIRNTQGPCL